MSKRKASVAEITVFCPECDKKTPHTGPGDNGGKITCLACKTSHEPEEVVDADTDAEEADVAETGGEDSGESEEGEEAGAEPIEDHEDHEDVIEGRAPGAASGAADADDGIDADEDSAPLARTRVSEEVEVDEEEEDEEEEADPDEEETMPEDEEGSDVSGLSSFGRSSFAEGSDEEEGAEAPAPKRKKKKKVVRKKVGMPKHSAEVRSWEEEVSHVDERKARSYSFGETYKLEEIISHAKFGMGKVVEVVNPTKISVLFKEGRKMMLQGQR